LNIKTSLTTRAFLFSFLPVCVVLAASFAALNALVQQRVKEGLRDSLEKSEELLARAHEDYSSRTNQFVGVLAESAGLKAAIGLLRETPIESGKRSRDSPHYRGATARDARSGRLRSPGDHRLEGPHSGSGGIRRKQSRLDG
jgi:hypothetical protein